MATIRCSIRTLVLGLALAVTTGCGAADTTTLAESPQGPADAPTGFTTQECELTTSDGTTVLISLAIPDQSPRRPPEESHSDNFPGGLCVFGQWTDPGSGAIYLAEDAEWSPLRRHEAAKAAEGDGGDDGTESAEYDDNAEMFGGLDGAVASHWAYGDGVPTYNWLAQAGGVTLAWSIRQANDGAQPDAEDVDLSVAKTIRDSVRITLPSR